MPTNPVIWFEIYVHDMERACRFYESVLQLKLTNLPQSPAVPGLEMWAFPMANDQAGAGGALTKMEGVASGGNSTLVYFNCDDCGVEAARIVPAGGRVETKKLAIGEYGFIALGVDTEGNMFGLHSMK